MKLRKIYTSAGILLLSLFCIGDAVAKDAKFETGVSFGSTGADEPYSSLTDKDGNYYISGMCRGDVEFAGGATIKGRGGMDAVIVKYDAGRTVRGQLHVRGLFRIRSGNRHSRERSRSDICPLREWCSPCGGCDGRRVRSQYL